MPLIEAILLLLVAARLGGEVAERMGQPAMIGEILAGVLLGPSVLDLIHMTSELKAIADIGVLLLVFSAGMEIDLHDVLAAVRGRGIWVGGSWGLPCRWRWAWESGCCFMSSRPSFSVSASRLRRCPSVFES